MVSSTPVYSVRLENIDFFLDRRLRSSCSNDGCGGFISEVTTTKYVIYASFDSKWKKN